MNRFKNNIKIIVAEQSLYTQVVRLCQKYLNITEQNKYKNEDKFKFQGKSARSQSWFDLDFDWVEEHFSTHETDLYIKINQRYDETKYTNTF